jgi:hypothetical protein
VEAQSQSGPSPCNQQLLMHQAIPEGSCHTIQGRTVRAIRKTLIPSAQASRITVRLRACAVVAEQSFARLIGG